MKTLTKCLIYILMMTTQSVGSQIDWPCWRGPLQNGSNPSGDYPVAWDLESEKVIWKIDIPGKGFSTPIVWDKKIYLTAGIDGLDTALAFDWSGNQIWKKPLGPEVAGKHNNASGSNPSAVTDGKSVFVFFKSGNFAAIDLDGSIRWQMNLFERYGKDNRYWDFGTSPALTQKYVVIAQMHDGESWVAAFDKVTGQLAWKVPRNYTTPKEGSQGYSTPVVFSHNGTEALLLWGGQHLTAHDAADGKMIWSCGDFNPEGLEFWPSAACPVISGLVAVVPCGRADRLQPRLHGIKLGGSGDITETHRLWKRSDTGAFVPTPGEYKGRIYIVSDHGQINCIDPLTGEDIWSGVFPKGKGNFYASPLIAGDHLYAAREDGVIFVLELKDKFEIISEINMKDKIIASPIAISDRLLIRTNQRLYCIEDK
jgi:outer membrane protein assembly factor BamB